MSTQSTQDLNQFCVTRGLVYRAEIGATIATSSTGVYYVGLVTGAAKIAILSRSYSSSESPLSVDLFQATFTAGAAVRTFNRDLSGSPTTPAQFLGGVNPGTLGAVITGITLRAPTNSGTAQVSIQADDNMLILKPSTSYVIRFTNGGGSSAVIGASIDMRLVLPSEL
jgi:hypothetical protein